MAKGTKKKSTAETKVAKVVNLSVSIGDEDSERLLSEFVEALKSALSGEAKSVTVTGSHYIIMENGSGKVCREPDYDPETRNFRPGATPPPWAGGAPEAQRVEKQQSVPAGARNPQHLRTVSETLRARAETGTGKKLRVKPGTLTGDVKKSAPSAATVADVREAEGVAEQTAESASSALLSKLRAGRK